MGLVWLITLQPLQYDNDICIHGDVDAENIYFLSENLHIFAIFYQKEGKSGQNSKRNIDSN